MEMKLKIIQFWYVGAYSLHYKRQLYPVISTINSDSALLKYMQLCFYIKWDGEKKIQTWFFLFMYKTVHSEFLSIKHQ